MDWDYSATSQLYQEEQPADASSQEGNKLPVGANQNTSLDLLYETLKQMQGEARAEGRRARHASQKIQASLKKVNKLYTDMAEKVAQVEERTGRLEDEVSKWQNFRQTQEKMAEDVQWKLEDFENLQRRNNIRLLGVAEGLEEKDPRKFVVKLLRGAFPEMTEWNWENEIQRAHRFPLTPKKSLGSMQTERPRAILIFIGNYLLRQEIIDKAKPNSKRSFQDITFFARPDFCHVTVERRWRLRQLIPTFQGLGSEAFLLFPAKLKVITRGQVRMFFSEVKAQQFVDELKGRKEG